MKGIGELDDFQWIPYRFPIKEINAKKGVKFENEITLNATNTQKTRFVVTLLGQIYFDTEFKNVC